MTGLDLRNRINEAIMSLPKPDAELQVAEVKELDQIWHLLSYEAKADVCDHPGDNRFNGFCFKCGRGVETEISTKSSG